MGNIYCFDTSAFIESWWRLYRPSSFPTFWAKMEGAVEGGEIIAPMFVLEELERKEGDQLYVWAKNQMSMFHPLDAELQLAQKNIVNKYPRLISEAKNRSLCDPWVIALAQIRSCTVISEENRGGNRTPKIPDVCEDLKIKCMKIADFIEELGWKF
ncbi:MAG: DUF4411 family protein [Chloroflexota bacterium]